MGKLRLGVDVTEAYSPDTVANACKSMGLTTGSSLDLRTCYDFTKDDVRSMAVRKVVDEDSEICIACLPCTLFGIISAINCSENGPGWETKFQEKRKHAELHFECAAKR